jgi:hypothetical protein
MSGTGRPYNGHRVQLPAVPDVAALCRGRPCRAGCARRGLAAGNGKDLSHV